MMVDIAANVVKTRPGWMGEQCGTKYNKRLRI
jgi:hypothetical protein